MNVFYYSHCDSDRVFLTLKYTQTFTPSGGVPIQEINTKERRRRRTALYKSKPISATHDVPRLPSYGMYVSQLIRFARVCSHVGLVINV